MIKPAFQINDGGRAAAGRRGQASDCVCRAIAIATERPYAEIYDALNEAAIRERPRSGRKRSSARTGIQIPTIRRYLAVIGWRWVPTMQIGSGCKVHLRADELPSGRLIVSVSRHMVAVIDGVVHDTDDPTRDGTRCVYGYYMEDPITDEQIRGLLASDEIDLVQFRQATDDVVGRFNAAYENARHAARARCAEILKSRRTAAAPREPNP